MKPLHWTSPSLLPISLNSDTIYLVSVAAFKTILAAHFSFDKPMLTENISDLKREVAAHVSQRIYETCFVGCLREVAAHVSQRIYETCFVGFLDDSKFIEDKYGIPAPVLRLAESIFEGLPAAEAVDFFAAFFDAVASDGKNLTRVVWQFLALELTALPLVPLKIQAVIDTCIQGMNLLARGELWPGAADAAEAAYAYAFCTEASAAEAAAGAAIFAGYSKVKAVCAAAAYVVRSCSEAPAASVTARRRQRDLLLRLISEAPITTTQEEN